MKLPIRTLFAAILVASITPQVARAGDDDQKDCASAVTMVNFPGYVDCRGAYSGNINGNQLELTALNAYWGGVWTWQGKSDDGGNGPFSGSPPNGSSPSTIGFDAPLSGTFVIGIKQGNAHSWYLYNIVSPITSIAIGSEGTQTGGPGFSHVALYTTDGDVNNESTINDLPNTMAPEPGSMFLLATGLAGMMGASRVRRRRKQS